MQPPIGLEPEPDGAPEPGLDPDHSRNPALAFIVAERARQGAGAFADADRIRRALDGRLLVTFGAAGERDEHARGKNDGSDSHVASGVE